MSAATNAAINSDWFHKQLAAHDISQRKLAKIWDVDPSAVTRILKGTRKMRIEEATRLAEEISVPLEDVLANAGIKRKITTLETLDITGWVDGELKVHWGTPKGPRTAPFPTFGGKTINVLRLQTSGTPFDGIDGSLVYFLPAKLINTDILGRMAIVKLSKGAKDSDGEDGEKGPSGDWRLAVVKRGYSAGTYNLVSMAGALMEEGVRLSAASPVIWLKF